MEIPDRIKQRLDGESITSAVSLGDEDLICFTPTRTLLYRGEGLLSDESLAAYDHDIERLNVAEGRRKTSFELEYVDSVEKFKVTNKRAEPVLTRLLGGVLGTKGVLDDEESVAGVFLFSEMTVVITDSRLVKHVGSYVWDPDFEEFPYEDVTGLEFEEGSVATQVVITVAGRPERIKAPSDKAEKLKRALSEALFSYYDVQSVGALNEKIGEEPEPEEETDRQGFGLDDSFSPLVSDGEDDGSSSETVSEEASVAGGDGTTMVADAATDDSGKATEETPETAIPEATETAPQTVDPEAIEEMQVELAKLTTTVEKQQDQLDAQSKQLRKQRETIEQLIEELRKQV